MYLQVEAHKKSDARVIKEFLNKADYGWTYPIPGCIKIFSIPITVGMVAAIRKDIERSCEFKAAVVYRFLVEERLFLWEGE